MFHIIEADLSNNHHRTALVTLIAEHCAGEFGRQSAMTKEEQQRLPEELQNFPSKLILLAEKNEVVVGVAICFYEIATFSARTMLKVHDLFVSPSERGQGIGAALITAATNIAQSNGCAFLNIEVATHNETAIKLYRNQGFVDWITPTQYLEKCLINE